jgi:hypothetical protein
MATGAEIPSTFQKKYNEFAADLHATFPELATEITAATGLSEAERMSQYVGSVLTAHATLPACPGPVLPGVNITEALWFAVSDKTQKAVYDYLSILDLCAAYESKDGPGKDWAEKIMREWRGRLDRVDFDSLSKKFMNMFGDSGSALPPLPEKFLKGKLAKLAEDMVREFKPEDFGFTEAEISSIEKDPTRAFEILMQAAMAKPEKLQGTMMRVAKKLQAKVQSGELKPQDLAAEAEELMKEFQSHPAFVEMMESFRSAFSFDNPEEASAAGRDNEGRLAMVRNRLKKKLEAKKAKK